MIPNGIVLLEIFISFYGDYVGIEPTLFYGSFDVLPQSGQKVTGGQIKVANKSPFFHIDIPSNIPNWAKK